MSQKYIKKRLKDLDMNEMIVKQLWSLKATLQKRKLKDNTVMRKLNHVSYFIAYLDDLRQNNIPVRFDNINDIAFTYVRDGYFTTEDKDGNFNYRREIYNNIREGINYIYEDIQDGEIIHKLTDEEEEILKEISKNNWFRCGGKKDTKDVNSSIQTQLIEKLGLKVYFDDDNKPYVYSHETAKLIGKNHRDMLKAIRGLLKNLDERKKSLVGKSSAFTMIEDFYEIEKKVGNNIGYEKRTTYRLYKDLLFLYILGLNGQKYFEFKVNYIDAFNFIEEEYNKILIKHVELKESVMKMYNSMRKQNRDLLISTHQ